MRPARRRDGERALEIIRGTPVAGWWDQARQVGIHAPAGHEVEDVTGEKPYDYEHAEEDIADSGVAEVFEAFTELFCFGGYY